QDFVDDCCEESGRLARCRLILHTFRSTLTQGFLVVPRGDSLLVPPREIETIGRPVWHGRETVPQRWRMAMAIPYLRKDSLHHIAVHIRQAIITTLEAKRQAFVVD